MDYTFPEPYGPINGQLSKDIKKLAQDWWNDSNRPRIKKDVLDHWQEELEKWSKDKNLPLFIRKQGIGRGKEIIHAPSGRRIITADNSPAWWSYGLTLNGYKPSISKIKHEIDNDHIPIAWTLPKADQKKATYKCTLKDKSTGWKVCHINPVRLGRIDLQEKPIEFFIDHFIRFISPSNIFLLPKALGPLGEQEDFLAEIKKLMSEDKNP